MSRRKEDELFNDFRTASQCTGHFASGPMLPQGRTRERRYREAKVSLWGRERGRGGGRAMSASEKTEEDGFLS